MASEDYSDLIAAAKATPKEDYSDLIAAAAPEQGGPESFLHPDKFKPSPAHRKFKNTGPIEQVRKDLDPQQYPTDAAATADMAAAPIYSMADRATLGAVTGAIRGYGGPTADRWMKEIENYRRSPVSNYSDLPAYMIGGPEMVAGAVERALPQVVNRGAQAARALLGAGLTSGAISGAESASRGDAPMEVLKETGRGYAGGTAVGLPLTGGSMLLRGAANSVLDSKGAKAREFLTDRGVKVGATTPGKGGPMDTMVATGTTDEAIGHQAEVSAKRGLDMLNEEQRAVKGGYGRRIGAVEQSGAGAELQDVGDIVRNMRDAVSELDTSPQARAALMDMVKSIEVKQGQHFNPDVDNYMLTATDVNKLRRQLDRYAKTGTSVDSSLGPLKSAASETRGMVNEGPFADVNADYARATKHYQESRGLLGINKRPRDPEETKTAVNTVKNLIGRQGQQTITAGGQTAKLGEFKLRHPDIGQELERPEVLRKRADIGFHLFPQHGGLIDRTESPIASVIAHALLGGATGILPALAYTNRHAINGRLLYTPAQEAQRAAMMMLGQTPQLSAAESDENRVVPRLRAAVGGAQEQR